MYISVVKGKNRNPIKGHHSVLNTSKRELWNSHIKNKMNLGENKSKNANAINIILK